jgi:BarA-like signal transduction histidine kinase
MTKGSGNLAVWTLATLTILGFLGCNPNVAPAPSVNVHLPVAEQRIFVDLPPNSRLKPADLLAQYYSGRRTISHVRQRCVVNPIPENCTEITDVRISAVEGARYINPGDAPAHPQLIAWLENLGTRTTYDGIEPMTSAVYALVVDSLPRANPTIHRVRFPVGLAMSRREIETLPNGHVYKCHEYTQQYISDADFQPCSPYRLIGAVALHSSSAQAMFAGGSETVALSTSDPTWFSCSSGCCSASQYQIYQVRSTPDQPHNFPFSHLLALGPSATH